MKCITIYSDLAYACVMVFGCDVVISRTRAPCLYLKNDVVYGPEYFEEYSVSDPTIGVVKMQTRAMML